MRALDLREGLEAGGAPLMWERALRDVLPVIRRVAAPGSRVLEVGYGDGLLTCWLCRELGWTVVGLEVSEAARVTARANAVQSGMADRIDFRVCAPGRTTLYTGQYDAVFIKTVLYNSADRLQYTAWLDWIVGVLKPGGHLINFESGRCNALTRLYRRVRRRPYANLCLYTSREEELYKERFEVSHLRYYGRLSQFFAPFAPLYRGMARLEEALAAPNADSCFVVSLVGRKPASSRAAEC